MIAVTPYKRWMVTFAGPLLSLSRFVGRVSDLGQSPVHIHGNSLFKGNPEILPAKLPAWGSEQGVLNFLTDM